MTVNYGKDLKEQVVPLFKVHIGICLKEKKKSQH